MRMQLSMCLSACACWFVLNRFVINICLNFFFARLAHAKIVYIQKEIYGSNQVTQVGNDGLVSLPTGSGVEIACVI